MPVERTILIVDDSETDRMTLKRYMARDPAHHSTFLEAETVADGLKLLAENKVDCVLLDFMLPDDTALQFIERARQGDSHLRIPIVIQTGTGSQADAVTLMKAGAHDYLVKGDLGGEALRMAVQNAIYRVETEKVIEQQQEDLRRSLEEVKKARDAAERANAVKDEFLAMLSHELRTPLTPILSVVSSTLSEKGLSPDLRETFSLISRNIQVEARLIDDLLDLTKILSGQFTVNRDAVDFATCWQAAAALCAPLIESKRLRVETTMPAQGFTLEGDFARLQQLFWTVLKNAAEFTPVDGRVEVSTSTTPTTLYVHVRDWGEGISPERLDGVFDVFQRPGGKQRFGTLGIGLSIARSIVEAHGGKISAQSEGTGHGATFAIELPLVAPAPSNGEDVGPGGAGAKSSVGRTVLVVDDHEDTRRVLARALRRRGFGVSMAGSAAEALSEFQRQPTDLVICDIGLPDGNGWDVIRRLRETSDVKAIAVTGYGMDTDIQRSKNAGFNGHITKPIEFPRLEQMMQSLFEKGT